MITAIRPYDDENTAIVFDGDPIDTTEGDVVANRAYQTGWSNRIAASSGGIVNLSNGRYPCMYRGIESPYGDIYEFVDGVNINALRRGLRRTLRTTDEQRVRGPYEQLGYSTAKRTATSWRWGSTPDHPYAEFPQPLWGIIVHLLQRLLLP